MILHRIYSTDELNKIFATALCYRQRYNIEYPYVIQTMLKLTYCLGLRSGEATRLLVEDIDLNNDLLYINETKFHKSRLVTANAPVMKMLKLYLDWRKSIVKENHFVDNHLFLDKIGNDNKHSVLFVPKQISFVKMVKMCVSIAPETHSLSPQICRIIARFLSKIA